MVSARSVAAWLMAAAVIPAGAQSSAEQERWKEGRKQRLETMERVKKEQQEAWTKFLAGAEADGVHLQCRREKPSPGKMVLYRGYTFRVDDGGGLVFWGRYRPADDVLTWWEGENKRWDLHLDGWLLQGSIPPSFKMEPDHCTKLKGDVREISAAAPELPLVR